MANRFGDVEVQPQAANRFGDAPAPPPAAPKEQGYKPGHTFFEQIGGKALMDLMAGASRTKEGAERSKAALTGLIEGIKNEPARVWSELSEAGRSMLNLDVPGTAYHIAGAVPIVGAPAQQAALEADQGKYGEAAERSAAILLPFAGKTRPAQALKRGVTQAVEKAAPVVERVGGAVEAGVKAGAPDVAKGTAKMAAGGVASQVVPSGPLRYAVGGIPAYSGARQIGRGLSKGRDAFRAKMAAATEKLATSEVTPGQALAKAQGIEWAALSAEDRALIETAAKAQANAAAQTPVGPRQPSPPPEVAPEPSASAAAPGKTAADMLREELEAKRGTANEARSGSGPLRPPMAAPEPPPPEPATYPLLDLVEIGRREAGINARGPIRPPIQPRTAADYAPRPVAVEPPAPATPEAPPLPSKEVVQPKPSEVPAAVEPPAPTLAQESPTVAPTSPTPAPTVAPTLNPVEIGRRVMRSMGMEDVAAKDALQAFNNLQELAARTGQPLEAVFQKYTGEPLAGVAAPPPPRPLSPKQGEAAMFRSKEATAPVNPNLDPAEARTFTAASGEKKSKALRAEEKKAYNADAKAKRFADAFHAEGITSEDVGNMTAADAKAMTDGLIAKGLLKPGEMPPNSSIPRLIAHLKDLERAKKAAPVEAPKVAPRSGGRGIEPTPELAHAAGTDAGNRSAKAGGRTTWNEEDYAAAAETYNKVLPEPMPVEAPAPAPAKEPWQMTRADLTQAVRVNDSAPGLSVIWPNKKLVSSNEMMISGRGDKALENFHRREIKRALSEGKPVPPEVLADYPELAKPAPETPVSRPAVDHGTLSPSGRVSKRAEAAAKARTAKELFGEGGLQKPQATQPTGAEALRRQAAELRALADRGMKPRAHRAHAAELEAKAEAMERYPVSIEGVSAPVRVTADGEAFTVNSEKMGQPIARRVDGKWITHGNMQPVKPEFARQLESEYTRQRQSATAK